MTINPIIALIIGVVGGFAIALIIYFIKRNTAFKLISQSTKIAEELEKNAKIEAENAKKAALLEAREEWIKQKRLLDEEIKERQKELRLEEKKYNERLSSLDKRLDSLDKKENALAEQERKLKSKEEELLNKKNEFDAIIAEQKNKLAEIAGLSREEAIARLREELISQARQVAANDARLTIEQIKLDANRKAAEILSTAIQRMAVDYVSETTVSVVSLPSDEMKGRIIGREGRNIRTFEKVSGVDLIIDDTPEAVVLSCFDPVRREVARLALEKLIADGRIHPGRIEEVIAKTAKEMEENLVKIGEKAVLETNIHNISPNLIKVLGRLHYRTSYGQNVLKHSVEVAHLAGVMAAELEVDVAVAKRAGLLHDIGKAVDHEISGPHVEIGVELAKKYRENKEVIHGIAAHHSDIEPESIEAILVQAADAISASRPGARRETLEAYIKRLEKLENLADSFEGVDKSFAIQAGREVRIIVKPDQVDDLQAINLARDIARKVEQDLDYPGQIKVIVIRETRSVE